MPFAEASFSYHNILTWALSFTDDVAQDDSREGHTV